MYDYLKGELVVIERNHIIVEVNGIGYIINVSNPSYYQLGNVLIYVYQYIKEDKILLYGFNERKEREIFLKLISIKGLGCKMALPMCTKDSIDNIINAINNENILYLKSFPKIGDKIAKQIILELKGKLKKDSNLKINNNELENTLKNLGYKQAEINKILPNINLANNIEVQLKDALKLLKK